MSGIADCQPVIRVALKQLSKGKLRANDRANDMPRFNTIAAGRTMAVNRTMTVNRTITVNRTVIINRSQAGYQNEAISRNRSDGFPAILSACMTAFIHARLAEIKTSAGAPAIIWRASVELDAATRRSRCRPPFARAYSPPNVSTTWLMLAAA